MAVCSVDGRAFNGVLPMLLSEVMLKKLGRHSRLDAQDIAILRKLSCQLRELGPGEDFSRQGDRPKASAVVMNGMLARYHTLQSGGRQYLSVHIAGDWPDAQGLFLDRMDHSVCAVGRASVCAIPHGELIKAFRERPTVAFSIWRETLIDAALFREAITNIGSRDGVSRMAHFFCEVYSRARAVDLVSDGVCALPFSQTQLGELLGTSLVSTARHLKALRAHGMAEFKNGTLAVRDFRGLSEIGEFDATYLHQRLQPNH
jgi:CRP-like cAMP-binding protein